MVDEVQERREVARLAPVNHADDGDAPVERAGARRADGHVGGDDERGTVVDGDGVLSDGASGERGAGADAFQGLEHGFADGGGFGVDGPPCSGQACNLLSGFEFAAAGERGCFDDMRLPLELAHEAAFQQDAFAVAAFAVEDVAEVLVAFEERGGPHGLQVLVGVLVCGQPLHELARLFDLFGLHVLRVDVHFEGVFVVHVVRGDVLVVGVAVVPPCAASDADATLDDQSVLLGDVADGVSPAVLLLGFGNVELDAHAVERLPVLGGAVDGGDAAVELFAVLSDANVAVERLPQGAIVAGVRVDFPVHVGIVAHVLSASIRETVRVGDVRLDHAGDALVRHHGGLVVVGDDYHLFS